ncbi:MAG TPA: hypothetical protein VHP13_03730 [Gammaproteobacteria bacterium]|nr:hypothetical protein [Gammaproteobacteria bacterium]
MKMLLQVMLVAALLCVTGIASADEQDFDVLKAMSVADFRASGLDKLSDAQIKALDAWFAGYQKQHGCDPAAGRAAAAPAVAEQVPAADDSISSYISGEFRGWSGGTSFRLDNGQVWEQTDDAVLTLGALTHPKVTISRGLFNSYYMSVEGVRDTVQVKRIKP